ncbi:hypothetical protein ACVWXU_004357 [Streptomyces sp. TE33382]
MLGRVAQQIAEDALQTPRIGGDPRLVHHPHRDVRVQHGDPPADELAQLQMLELGPLRSTVQPRHFEHVLDEGAHRLRPVAYEFGGAARRQQLGRREQPGHRRTQLMGDVRGDPALRLDPLVQRVGQRVDRPCQLIGLVADDPADGLPDPDLRVSLRDLPGRGRRLAQPAGELAADQDAQGAAAEDHRDRADDQCPVQVLHDRGAAVGEPGVQREDVTVGQRYGRPDVGHPVLVLLDMGGPPVVADLLAQARRQRGVVELGAELGRRALRVHRLVEALGAQQPLQLHLTGVLDHRDLGGVVDDKAQRHRDERADRRDRDADLPADTGPQGQPLHARSL